MSREGYVHGAAMLSRERKSLHQIGNRYYCNNDMETRVRK